MSAIRGNIDFTSINAAALKALPAICARLLCNGHREGQEWVAKNPTRTDRSPGSFKINLKSGRWADFATNDKGSDPVSLVAYVEQTTQTHAAHLLSRMLGIKVKGVAHD